MTQGIRINHDFAPSKKAVKEAVAAAQAERTAIVSPEHSANRTRVSLVATSFFGNEYDGNVLDAPDGFYTFVGPDENRRRNFFGNIIVKGGKVTVK